MILDRLLRPKSIAVIGGGGWCANVLEQCNKMGYDGALWPVHPTRSEIGGVPAFASLDDLPGPPDACFVGINRFATVEAIAALSGMGAGGAICFASGFAEAEAELAGASSLQSELLDAAGDMPILGPNCYGLLNYVDGVALWPDQHGGIRVESGAAIITQSSNIAINLTMQTRGLPLSYVVTSGNQAQVDLAEIGCNLLQDSRVTCLGIHVEGFNNIKSLESLAKVSRELKKPIIAIKVGTSEQAQKATQSHTASMAGSSVGSTALLRRLGIAIAPSLPVFLETLKVWHVAGALPSNQIASMSCSGGEASLMADHGQEAGLKYPELTPLQIMDLGAALGPKVALANPLDYHTYVWGDVPAMTACFTAMMQGDYALGIAVLDFPRTDRCSLEDWNHVIECVHASARTSGKPMAILASLPETMPEFIAERLIDLGIIPLNGMDHALQAVALAVEQDVDPVPVLLPKPIVSSQAIDEARAKSELAAFGLSVPKGAVGSREDVIAATHDLTAPFVLKGMGAAHKSELGLVALNLSTIHAVETAAAQMDASAFYVEEMVSGALAELLIGVTLDPAHGYVLTVGAGGTHTELLQDTAHLLVPASEEDIDAALDTLRIGPALRGFRGKPSCDRPAIIAAIMAIQKYVVAKHGKLAEIEVNPLICTETGAIAVDALCVLGD